MPRYERLHAEAIDLLKAYHTEDPPPDWVNPLPIQLIQHTVERLQQLGSQLDKAIVDSIIIGFFFLLRPGEYAYNNNENHPFQLQDVSFVTPHGTLNAVTAPILMLGSASDANLLFTTQKSGECNKVITHGDTQHTMLLLVKALLCCIHHQAPYDTPLYCTYVNGKTRNVTGPLVTNALC